MVPTKAYLAEEVCPERFSNQFDVHVHVGSNIHCKDGESLRSISAGVGAGTYHARLMSINSKMASGYQVRHSGCA